MESIKDRLIQLAQSQGLSIRAFEEKCGLGRGNVSNMGTTSSIGSDKLTKIIDKFPGVDIFWVLTGRQSEPAKTETNVINDPELINKLLNQAEEIGRLKERIRQLEAEAIKNEATHHLAPVTS